jgi:hypothetical protein
VSNKGRAQFFARSLVESADRFALNDWRFSFRRAPLAAPATRGLAARAAAFLFVAASVALIESEICHPRSTASRSHGIAVRC